MLLNCSLPVSARNSASSTLRRRHVLGRGQPDSADGVPDLPDRNVVRAGKFGAACLHCRTLWSCSRSEGDHLQRALQYWPLLRRRQHKQHLRRLPCALPDSSCLCTRCRGCPPLLDLTLLSACCGSRRKVQPESRRRASGRLRGRSAWRVCAACRSEHAHPLRPWPSSAQFRPDAVRRLPSERISA